MSDNVYFTTINCLRDKAFQPLEVHLTAQEDYNKNGSSSTSRRLQRYYEIIMLEKLQHEIATDKKASSCKHKILLGCDWRALRHVDWCECGNWD